MYYNIRFYGNTRKVVENGREKSVWEGGEIIMAKAYFNIIFKKQKTYIFKDMIIQFQATIPLTQLDLDYGGQCLQTNSISVLLIKGIISRP